MSSAEAVVTRAAVPVRARRMNGAALLALIGVIQVMWLAALVYGVIWLVTW